MSHVGCPCGNIYCEVLLNDTLDLVVDNTNVVDLGARKEPAQGLLALVFAKSVSLSFRFGERNGMLLCEYQISIEYGSPPACGFNAGDDCICVPAYDGGEHAHAIISRQMHEHVDVRPYVHDTIRLVSVDESAIQVKEQNRCTRHFVLATCVFGLLPSIFLPENVSSM